MAKYSTYSTQLNSLNIFVSIVVVQFYGLNSSIEKDFKNDLTRSNKGCSQVKNYLR